MSIVRISHRTVARLAVAALVALGGGACGLDRQSAPDLIGPSEFALSLTLSASPDILTQDGRSQTVITALARDDRSRPVPNVTILWRGTASTSRLLPVRLSASSSVTDANGIATVVLSSPLEMATETPSTPATITVIATPVGNVDDFTSPRLITVQLRPVTSASDPTPPPSRNNPPVPVISVSSQAPVVGQTVTFDGSLTTDEGEVCLSRCSYSWNFGDRRSAEGRIVQHTYTEASATAYTVTLTVTDERGGTAAATRTLTVVPDPAVPVARFTFSPSDPIAGSAVTFDARSSTASSGAVIRTYNWNFGDGTEVSTGTPTIDHTYTEGRAPYHVTLTVTDTNTRTSAPAARDITVRD